MITSLDVKSAVVAKLKGSNFNVIATEIKEGFKKPVCFVDVLPQKTTIENIYLETDTYSVEIKYIPKAETNEECIKVAERMKNIFLYSTLNIKDRKITITEIEFDVEDYVLYISFDLGITQSITKDETADNMEELSLNIIKGDE